ncbi:alpha-ketoacid dehydrogenase kinase [Suhomyces tanzawaensis NRRL Y-17324]|uniref:Protein-serine/threonine kinase n=1 Tax=Suhomyces tanzawaensis NRRL Y-17324 TaxID=984487 RepID=A0A1E4SFB2_9ASCO|nr:alpha-ketoacid dehydrogenase kinase [Suhomyces tanzawaensis NRRL Y-17324]ODV78173.1 alpha-ketoacid dehydrogenase kinase [Suhomyces tanzawaensis NRRL Y-17324]
MMFRRIRPVASRLGQFRCQSSTTSHEQSKFLEEYKIRTMLERPIYYYANKDLPKFSMQRLYQQSERLSEEFIINNAQGTVEHLLAYNARRLKEFRNLPYLVVLNPSISESYNTYLQTMSSLITASLDPPKNLDENQSFTQTVLEEFIDVHADTLPSLSKGFQEVSHLLSVLQIKDFLDKHLKERISMRLIAHQHIKLSESLAGKFVQGGRYNGVIKQLNIPDVIRKNAELVNDICLMKYDQSVPIKIDHNLYPKNYWSQQEPDYKKDDGDVLHFPYIEYHLDYILTEVFKNSFRAHIENKVEDPVQITISTSAEPSFLELRIRDKGKGIQPKVLLQIFDYSFSTFESGEGESYKTLNVPPGVGGNVVAGMGYGLPLLKNYVEIFNDTIPDENGILPDTKGLLTIQSYYGWGTDIYLKTVGN